ncbi:pyridoxamine 5'-phosphate oxidase family protein [Streptomyces sp. NPDC102270]|uniref:pyridoxamine 5'-phosphate oxidase family protein n=1 Tax=Streptomyces sp. NPDC102270 TaxID=3366150 RepID=UPI0038114590
MSTPNTAREMVDAALYLVLATADADGRPWSSPAYFAHDSHNIAAQLADRSLPLAPDRAARTAPGCRGASP